VTNIIDIQTQLLNNSDLDWFDCFCDILKKENKPTVFFLIQVIGNENPDIKKENRGSKFLIPFDERFKTAAINPDLDSAKDAEVEYFAIGGHAFEISIKELKTRFNLFSIESNIYDGGTQLFFYPIPEAYAFRGISCYFIEEKQDIKEVDDLVVSSVSFHFGNRLIKLRDGYSMTN